MKFRKKPIVIEAQQFIAADKWPEGVVADARSSTGFAIDTLEGRALAVADGDWIITGVQGERYPCKPDIFAATYEPAEASPTPSAHSGEQGKPSDLIRELRDALDMMRALANKTPALQGKEHDSLGIIVVNCIARADAYLARELERKHEQSELVARDREADRKRFPDPAFNEWLDVGISDSGHTVWDLISSVGDALAGWQNRPYYAPPPSEQAGIAHSNSCSISDEVVERAAKAVYDAFVFVPGCDGMKEKPAWAERGNSFKQSEARRYARAALQSAFPRGVGSAEPVEMSPEFTDSARGAIAWVLYHHQGGNSPIGQPLRFALGMGAHEPLRETLIADAFRYSKWSKATTADFHAHPAPEAQAEGEAALYAAADWQDELRIDGDVIVGPASESFVVPLYLRPQPSASETPSADVRDADDPYFVEVDANGCSKCGHARSWTVIYTGNGVAMGKSWHNEEDANEFCEHMNEAYANGFDAAIEAENRRTIAAQRKEGE